METDLFKVFIGDKIWGVGPAMKKNLIDTAEQAMSKEHKMGITAVEKEGTVFMKNEPFKTTLALNRAIREYQKEGFKVSYFRKK